MCGQQLLSRPTYNLKGSTLDQFLVMDSHADVPDSWKEQTENKEQPNQQPQQHQPDLHLSWKDCIIGSFTGECKEDSKES